MHLKTANLLLVDDSEADRVIIQRALEDGKLNCELICAQDGAEALARLRGELGKPAGHFRALPDLILLDINMPVLDGFATLSAIRADASLQHIPVIMLTTSDRERDVFESYRLGVNAYLTKPVDELAFMRVIAQLENFWFTLATLPPRIVAG